MKEISENIYNLEREFRALIEISFLKQKGKKWYKTFYQDNDREKNRVEKRPQVIQKINNPLDNRDFVDLSEFVTKNISTSKNTILKKLEIIEEMFDESQKSIKLSSYSATLILEKLDEIKEATDHKNQGIAYNKLFDHLTPALADEWKELYEKRNLWAHNYCLLTLEELNRFKFLSKVVLRKIRTEITLLSILDDEEKPLIISGDFINLKLYKMRSEGTTICKLKVKINIGTNNNRLIEVSKATYNDLLKISKILAEFIDDCNSIKLLENLSYNPFLSDIIKETFASIINSTDLKAKLETHFSLLEESLINGYPNAQEEVKLNIKTINKKESKMDSDLDLLLEKIF